MPFMSYLPSYYQGVTEIEAIADAFDLEMVDLQENLSFYRTMLRLSRALNLVLRSGSRFSASFRRTETLRRGV